MKSSLRFSLSVALAFVCCGGILLAQAGKTKQPSSADAANAVKLAANDGDPGSNAILCRQPNLTWRVLSMDFGWEAEAVHDFLEKTEDGQIKETIKSLDSSGRGSFKIYREAEMSAAAEFGVQGIGSLNISKTITESSTTSAGRAGVSAKLGIAATGELGWRRQNKNRARDIKHLLRSVAERIQDSRPYIEFSVLFIDDEEQEYSCKDLQVPVLAGPRLIVAAQCYGIEPAGSFNITPKRPAGTVIRFRAHLADSQALALLDDLENTSPSFKLENGRGSIIATKTQEDLLSQSQIADSRTCLLTIRRQGSPPVSWQIYRDSPGSPVTLRLAMEAVNERVKALAGGTQPVFNLKSGIIESIAGFDNHDSCWWHVQINGESVPIDLNMKLTSGIDFVQAEGVPLFSPSYLEAVRERATSGDAFAQLLYGSCFYNGVNVAQDYSEAATWYRLAAEQGEPDGQAALGACFLLGTGVEKNEAESAKWFQLAAERGSADGQFLLGIAYLYGRGVEKNEREAVRWFRSAAEQGEPYGQAFLGECYLTGKGMDKNEQEAVRCFRRAAEQENSRGQFYLGACYKDGMGTVKSEREAVRCFHLAAEQGDPDGQAFLGKCYLSGTGVEKNEQEATKWFRLAAEQGNSDGQAFLGLCHAYGVGIAEDEQEAIRLCRLAAGQDNPHGLCNLGLCYLHGIGAPKNAEEAVRLFTLAAERGYPDGQYYLGMCYKDGAGTAKSEDEAIKWLRRAAERGFPEAQTELETLPKQ